VGITAHVVEHLLRPGAAHFVVCDRNYEIPVLRRCARQPLACDEDQAGQHRHGTKGK
jgi:hypothetical protein